MPRHPTARRIHRVDTTPDDAFIARILDLWVWARNNSRILTIAAVVVVLGTAIGLYYRSSQAAMREQAAATLTEVRQTVASGNTALALRDLESFLTRFGNTEASDEARILMAQIHLNEGRHSEAVSAIRQLAANPERPLGASAGLLLAAAYEASGNAADAEATYLRVADRAQYPFQQRQALDAAARVRIDQGNLAGAVTVLERLVAATPEDNPEHNLYVMRLAEARARAAQPAATAAQGQ